MVNYVNSLLFSTIFLFGGGAVAADSFICTLKPVTKTGWIPERVAVQFKGNRETASIRISEDRWLIPAVLKQRSSNSFLFDWTPSRALAAKATELSNDRYRAVLNLGNLKVSLQVLTESFPGVRSPRGAGTCTKVGGT